MPSAARRAAGLRCDVWKTFDAGRGGQTWERELSDSKLSILGIDVLKPRALAEVRGHGLG